MRILLVEDNTELARQIQQSLEVSLYVVDIADDGREGRYLGETEPYDLVILDLGLPFIDGLSVLTAWRDAGNQVPVLILTSRDTWREKVTGLRAGADDYLAKPFEMEELHARVEALLRRSSGHPERVLSCGCGSVLVAMTDRGDTYQFADDFDGDGIEDDFDNCPFLSNWDQDDTSASLPPPYADGGPVGHRVESGAALREGGGRL